MQPQPDGQAPESAASPTPAPEAAIPTPGAERNFDAEIAEAVRLANEEAEQLQAADAADGAEGGSTPPATPDQATPARPTPTEEQGADGSAEEDAADPDIEDAPSAKPGEDAASFDARLRSLGFSRSQRKAIRELTAEASQAAKDEAIAQVKASAEAADRLKQQDADRQRAYNEANQGLAEFIGDDTEYTRLQQAYDRDELWGDDKARFVELKSRRAMAPVIWDRLWAKYVDDLRVSDDIEGVEKGLHLPGGARDLRDYAQRVAQGHARAKVAEAEARWRERETTWKTREDDLEGAIEEHETTIASLKKDLAARSPSPMAGGRAPVASGSAGVLQAIYHGADGDPDKFVEDALAGRLSHLDLTGS